MIWVYPFLQNVCASLLKTSTSFKVYFQYHFLLETFSLSAPKYFSFGNIFFKSKMIKSLVLLKMHWRHQPMAMKCRWKFNLDWIISSYTNIMTRFANPFYVLTLSWPGLETLCKVALYLLLIPKMTDTGFHCLVSGSCVLWWAALPFWSFDLLGQSKHWLWYVLKGI